MSPCPRRARLHAKQISVSSSTIPRHKGPFWSVLFRLSVRSRKFSNEVLHVKFDLQSFVKGIYLDILSCSDERKFGIESLQYLFSVMSRIEEIVGLVVEQIDVLS